MSTLRTLPPRPSLEFERKQAKALHRRLRAGDADAIARACAQDPAIDASSPARIKLSGAQLVIAREYGFTSWPRLVRYFRDVERQRDARRGLVHEPEFCQSSVRSLLAGHRARHSSAARAFASYVPRFYGRRSDEIFPSTVTEDEARLAVARMYGFPSWELLLERSVEDTRRKAGGWDVTPWDPARKAIAAADLQQLQRLVAAHPELLEVRDDGRRRRPSLLGMALAFERQRGVEALRPIMEWLVSQGFDVQRALNEQLLGHIRMDAETVRYLLDRGADPNWVAPNGIPALEHALITYWNGAAVDLLAKRAVPRSALWIAAGRGDMEGVRSFLDRRGKPTAAARRIRPDFVAVGSPLTQYPDPDDEEILLEAFLVAILNGRTAVLEYMISRGTPVNALFHETPLINFAVGNRMTTVVECLVRAGANLDLKGRHPDMTARELARELFEQAPEDPARRQIVELCGLDPDVLLAARDARPVMPPAIHPHFEKALQLASDDAVRLGHSAIHPENLLFGVLRNREGGLNFFTRVSELDLDRFRADVNDRMHAADDRVESARLPMHPDAQAIVDAAIAAATERRRDLVNEFYLLYSLTRDACSAAAELLRRYGGNASKLIAELERGL